MPITSTSSPWHINTTEAFVSLFARACRSGNICAHHLKQVKRYAISLLFVAATRPMRSAVCVSRQPRITRSDVIDLDGKVVTSHHPAPRWHLVRSKPALSRRCWHRYQAMLGFIAPTDNCTATDLLPLPAMPWCISCGVSMGAHRHFSRLKRSSAG